MKKKNIPWKQITIFLIYLILFFPWIFTMMYISSYYGFGPYFVSLAFFSYILIPLYGYFIIDILKVQDRNKRTKQLLRYFTFPIILISIAVTSILIELKIIFPYATLILWFPGWYILYYTLRYKEYDERHTHFSGNHAIVVGFSYFLGFFCLTGIPLIALRHISIDFQPWYILAIAAFGFVFPRLIYFLFFKKKSLKPIVTYDIQEPDFKMSDNNEEITFEKAKTVVENYDWKKQLEKKSRIESSGDEACPPQILFNSNVGVFSIIGIEDESFKIYVDIQIPQKDKLLKEHFVKQSRAMKMEKPIELLQLFFENRLEDIKRRGNF